MPRQHIERDMQAALFEIVAFSYGKYPQLKTLHAIPNGQYRRGQSLEPGTKKGMPDLNLPVARDGFHSFYIELKAPGEKPRPDQLEVHEQLRAEGNRVDVYWSWETAYAALCAYLEQPPTEVVK